MTEDRTTTLVWERTVEDRTLPRIKASDGRREDTILTPDGRFVTGLFIVPEFARGARFVQFVQEGPDRLSVRVVPGRRWSRENEERLSRYVKQAIGEAMTSSIRTDRLLHIADRRRRGNHCRKIGKDPNRYLFSLFPVEEGQGAYFTVGDPSSSESRVIYRS